MADEYQTESDAQRWKKCLNELCDEVLPNFIRKWHQEHNRQSCYLELDDRYAGLLYLVHRLGPKAFPQTIAKKLQIRQSDVSKHINKLLEFGYLKLNYATTKEQGKPKNGHETPDTTKPHPNANRLNEYELALDQVVSFQSTAILLLELVRSNRRDAENKIRIDDLITDLMNSKIKDFNRLDLLGDSHRKGVLDRLEEADYIERTANFIRARNRVALEEKYLELIANNAKIDAIKPLRTSVEE